MMRCPVCEGKTIVINSMEGIENSIRRRRKCVECGYRFNTNELPPKVTQKDKSLHPVALKIRL